MRSERLKEKGLKMNSRVEFKDRSIIIDGKVVQIVAGAMHYFRVPREYWHDRLQKAVQMGMNGIETYLCWNLHERKEGEFDFSGMLDFEEYIREAQAAELYVILRLGPYICAEWDNGALPFWLMTKPGIRVRRMNGPYIEALDRYLDQVLPKLKRLQYDEGGPIIAMQIENEYGTYSCDKTYLAYLRDACRNAGITIPLFTANGVDFSNAAYRTMMIRGGILEGTSMCLNFGSRGLEAFDRGKEFRPDDPPFCTEFWQAWFDDWGGKHHTRPVKEITEEFDDMLGAGGSVDFYMYHGGTDFMFTAGSNGSDSSPFAPHVTNYDFDSPLNECGDPTEKYFALQSVLKKYAPDRPYGTPTPSEKMPPQRLKISGIAPLFENLDVFEKTTSTSPLTFEELGLDFGYVYYRTHIAGPAHGPFVLHQVRDRANLYLNDEQFYVYYRNDKSNRTPEREVGPCGADFGMLVENLGRINYGHLLGRDTKGICEDVAVEWQILVDWDMWKIPVDTPSKMLNFKPFRQILRGRPAFYKIEWDVEKPADAFLQFPGIHGGAWINGKPLGRYWNIGPGSTLYIPGVWLKKGRNELVIFETEKLRKPYVDILDHPEFDKAIGPF